MFSKSRLKSAAVCLKRAYLEKHHKDLAVVTPKAEARFRTGHEVGEKAKEIYSAPGAYEIPYQEPLSRMVEETESLLASGFRAPIFEATFQHRGVLVRVDVLLPDGEFWRAIEIKATTSVEEEHHMDCAIQLWVMRGAGLPVTTMSLGYVDNTFVYRGHGNYGGFIIEEDLTQVADDMAPNVEALIVAATEAIVGDRPGVPVGRHCEEPYECSFVSVCWPRDIEYPVRNIGGKKERIFEWIERGYKDIREIPADEVTSARQKMIHRVTTEANPLMLTGAKTELEGYGYPRYHLDFETTMPAVPIWAESRPYQTHAVQFSVHVDDGASDGSLESTQHYEFLDLSGEAPMRPLTESLIATLGTEGPVFMWHHYEKTVINGLIKLYPDLQTELQAILDRLIDLKKVTERYYYHPDMQGSYSIKFVAPTVNPVYDYAALEGINEGGAAADGYLEAIHPDTSLERKAELEEQLLRYCRFDTEAMVEIAKFLSSIG